MMLAALRKPSEVFWQEAERADEDVLNSCTLARNEWPAGSRRAERARPRHTDQPCTGVSWLKNAIRSNDAGRKQTWFQTLNNCPEQREAKAGSNVSCMRTYIISKSRHSPPRLSDVRQLRSSGHEQRTILDLGAPNGVVFWRTAQVCGG